jgi:hypothetical protein
MPVPSILAVSAGARFLASHYNGIKDYLDWLLNKPGVQTYRTVAGTLGTATWSNAIGMDGEDYDRDGMHDTVTNNARVFFQTAGRYRVTATLTWASNATGIRGIRVAQNSGGSATGGTELITAWAPAVNGQESRTEVTFSKVFVAGDYIEMFGHQTSGGTLAYATGIRKVAVEATFEGTT